MGRRCQVCDGPVVNGRCSLCGMPYRNDEIMYHLNENRRDHYKHASWRARMMMEDAEIPYGDKPIPDTPPKTQSKAQPQKPGSASRSYIQSTYKGNITKKSKKKSGMGAVIVWIVIILWIIVKFLSSFF